MPPSTRTLRVLGVLVAALLLALSFYPGTVASPYAEGYEHQHRIVPETAAGYNETFEEAPEYRYSELSPRARTFFDRTRSSPNDEYEPTVCEDWTLTCDAYEPEELPDEFTYGDELPAEEATVVVRDGDEAYLLKTGTTRLPFFYVPFRLFKAWAAMIPASVFVGGVALRAEDERLLAGVTGAGAIVGLVGFATPYIEMFGPVQAPTLANGLLVGVWTGFAGLALYYIER